MAVTKPASVPQRKIESVDHPNMGGGLFLGGDTDAPANAFIESVNAELTVNGYMIPRRRLERFLPDTVETTYQKAPVSYNGVLYYFTADANKVKFCKEGDAGWTDCGGSNTITTNNGGFPKFLRVLNSVLILNGKNGDKLAYVDLTTVGFPVVKYTAIADPTGAPTVALTNLAAGSFPIYYAYSYSGSVGETELSPIFSEDLTITRDQWQTNTATPSSIKVTRPGTAPAGAKYWNLYVATAATSGAIQPTDMLQLAVKLDLATSDFVDDGTLSINLGGVAPTANSTDGPKVSHGITEDGNPVLYGDETNPYNIWIGGGGPNALDFSISNGGYLAQPEQGSNFFPTVIIGFRNGQGIPSLTVLYSNTEGLSKQSVLEQQTVNYGNQSFTVWGVTEQHYGAAGVAATNSAINYNGQLLFLSTDGFMSMNTQPLRQNVISTDNISIRAIDAYVRLIKNSAMPKVVGAGWQNKYMWIIPNAGFDTPQQILVYDTNNPGTQGKGAWYTLDVPADWIGVVSPLDEEAFVYISQGQQTYKLLASNITYDTKSGLNETFQVSAKGPLAGVGGNSHNTWFANVQTVFYILGLIGDITVGVNYRNQNGKLKTKQKTFHGPTFTPSADGGWSGVEWTYAHTPAAPGWRSAPISEVGVSAVTPRDVRIPVQVDDIMNEAQWFFSTELGYSYFKLRAVSHEGIALGVRPDLA